MYESGPLSGVFTVAAAGSVQGITSDYMGMTINGPVQAGLTWPVWNPTTFRILDQFDTATGGFLPGWANIETSNGVYVWTTFDAIAAKYIAQGATNLIWGFQGLPQWALIGNSYTRTTTFNTSTDVVTSTTAVPSTFANNTIIFFNGGVLPGGLTAGTDYYVINQSGNTFQVSLTAGGAAIDLTGTPIGTTTMNMEMTPPSSLSLLTSFINSYLTEAAADGLNLAYIEGSNEPNNVPAASNNGWQGTMADMVTLQQTIWNAVQNWNAANNKSIKVLSPPVSDAGSYNNSGSWGWEFLTSGGGAYFDILAYHAYPDFTAGGGATLPEVVVADIAQIKSVLALYGLSKPIWITEYSAGSGQSAATNTTFASITTIMAAAIGVQRQYWYAYDNNGGFGQLWTSGGGLNAAGIAIQQLNKWLIGAIVSSTPWGTSATSQTVPGGTGGSMTFATAAPLNLPNGSTIVFFDGATDGGLADISGTVTSNVGLSVTVTVTAVFGSGTYTNWAIGPQAVTATVNFTRSGGYQAQAVWTTDGSTPSYTVPVWATQYHDLAGSLTTGIGATVTLGRNPILLENFSVF